MDKGIDKAVLHVNDDGAEILHMGRRRINTKRLIICNWCMMPTSNSKAIVCAGKGCDLTLCNNCATEVTGRHFCSECLAEIVKKDTLILVTKGEVGEDK